MNKKLLYGIAAVILIIAFGIVVSGCSHKEVSSQTLEDGRAQSVANSVTIAKAYIRENPRLAGMDVVGHADEHQTLDCPQGSGWAYPSAMRNTLDDKGNVVGLEKIKLVCSTVSANLGCYRESDFKGTAFAVNAGKCDTKLPFPLPKVVGK